MVGDDRSGGLSMLAHRPRRASLIITHQARIADHVDSHDRGEAASTCHRLPQQGFSIA
jgi:hypothetical protein